MRIHKLRLLEFVIFGVIMNLLDNLISIKATTGATISLRVLGIVLLLVLPFAVMSELIVDHPDFWRKVLKFLRIEIKELEKKIESRGFHTK